MHDFTDIIHTFIGFVYTVMHSRFKNDNENKQAALFSAALIFN